MKFDVVIRKMAPRETKVEKYGRRSQRQSKEVEGNSKEIIEVRH